MGIATAIIVHFGDLTPTVNLAKSLRTLPIDIVIVSNDQQQCPECLLKDVEWLLPARNLGYGDAFNFAHFGRDSEIFVLLNTDLIFNEASFMTCLNTIRYSSDIGILGPVLRYPDGSLQSGAATVTRWRRAPRVLREPGRGAIECDWITGAAMFIKRDVAEVVGMDGSYFLGSEDMDLCVRARNAGWKVVCCGDAPVVHLGSQVIGSAWYYYSTRNRIWYTRENVGLTCACLNWVTSVVSVPRVFVADVVKRRTLVRTRLMLLGIVHAWKRKPARGAGSLRSEPLVARITG